VAMGFGGIARDPMARTIWISDTTWIAKEPLERLKDIKRTFFIGPEGLDLLLGAWRASAETLPVADLDRDGVVNAGDLGLLKAGWESSRPGGERNPSTPIKHCGNSTCSYSTIPGQLGELELERS